MRKKNSTLDEKRFEAYALSVYLANECYKRDNQSGKTANRGYDGTIKQNTLASVLADKATIVSQRLTFIGYLKIAVTLLTSGASFSSNNTDDGIRLPFTLSNSSRTLSSLVQ